MSTRNILWFRRTQGEQLVVFSTGIPLGIHTSLSPIYLPVTVCFLWLPSCFQAKNEHFAHKKMCGTDGDDIASNCHKNSSLKMLRARYITSPTRSDQNFTFFPGKVSTSETNSVEKKIKKIGFTHFTKEAKV